MRIYLFRPILALTCTSPGTAYRTSGDDTYGARTDDLLNYRIAMQCSLLCIKTAIELIRVTYENLATSNNWGKRPTWLYGVRGRSLFAVHKPNKPKVHSRC